MPNSLRCRIKKLCYQGIINEKDCDRLIMALDNMDALDKIRSEITAIAINGQVDEHTAFIRTADQVKHRKAEVRNNGMRLRTKGEQKAYLDGFEMCGKCIEQYLTDEGKRKLESFLLAVRNAVEIEDIGPQESEES